MLSFGGFAEEIVEETKVSLVGGGFQGTGHGCKCRIGN